MENGASKIIVAIDTPNLSKAESIMDKLTGHAQWFKIGMELFYAAGWDAVKAATDRGAHVFLDLKFNDIPNTVAGACRSCVRKGVGMLNMHATAGLEAMRQAKAETTKAGEATGERPLLIAVTVLTSLDQTMMNNELGIAGSVEDSVVRLATLTQQAGLDGVVASPLEVSAIKNACGKQFKVVTPGVRPAWSAAGDQKRFTTPKQAIELGADFMVIGRPIAGADNPKDAFRMVCEEIEA